jgi:hypothetical protein
MRTLLLLLILATCAPLSAQVYPVDTLVYQGFFSKRINLVIFGDGYRSEDMDKFKADANKFLNAFFEEKPFKQYRKYFNVFSIQTPSIEAGADHPGTATDVSEPAHPVSAVNTFFDATFDFGNIHRLLVATSGSKVYSILAENFPFYDQVIILVNSPYYGGSGGGFPVASTDASATEVALHELGHSFASLADEYWFTGGESPNRTAESNPTLVKWKNWVGSNGVGVYQYCCGGDSPNWYRPHENCKMRTLGPDFCPVCTQALIEKIHNLSSPLENYSPTDLVVPATSNPLPFSVTLVQPEPNTLKVQWVLNDSIIATQTDSITLLQSQLQNGTNSLKCFVEDTTALLRVDGHATIHVSTAKWLITKAISGLEQIQGSTGSFQFKIFPNPSSEYVQIQCTSDWPAPAIIRLLDAQGKQLNTWKMPVLGANETFKMDITPFPKGVYQLEVRMGSWSQSRTLIKGE